MTGRGLLNALSQMDDQTLDRVVIVVPKEDMTIYTDQYDTLTGAEAVEDDNGVEFPMIHIAGDPRSYED